jgi:hypothetical protein
MSLASMGASSDWFHRFASSAADLVGRRISLLGLESMSDGELRTLQHEFNARRDRVVEPRKRMAARSS